MDKNKQRNKKRKDKRVFNNETINSHNGFFFCDKHINSHKLEFQHKLVVLSSRVTVVFRSDRIRQLYFDNSCFIF